MSELTGDGKLSFPHDETSSLDAPVSEPKPTEWTDEKHILYLKSMEASFVSQYYNSMCNSSYSHFNTRSSCGQFKSLQDGYWRKINFVKEEYQLNRTEKSHTLERNPWIQHFRNTCRDQVMASNIIRENIAEEDQEIDSGGKKASSCRLANSSKQLIGSSLSSSVRQDSIGLNTEVSDQNFIDETVEGGRASNKPTVKRRRTQTARASATSDDQVVPFKWFPITAVSNENHLSGKDKKT